MMSNLFSIFDTNTNSMFEMNWISSILIFFINPINYWMFNNKMMLMMKNLHKIIYIELSIILKNKFNNLNCIYFMSILMMISLNNMMGLFPYIFTSSSHMIFSMSISLPLWLSLMIFNWKKNMNFMFAHMIPQGTPNMLMPFMVMIETTSNSIRPGTLTIRLTANMIAGHLLLTLLSQSACNNMLIMSMLIIMTQIILLMLEMSVSIIQAYVFMILSTLYTKETTN